MADMLLIRYLLFLLLALSYQSWLVGGQENCIDQQWCAGFQDFCTNEAYRIQMQQSCPLVCGVCGGTGSDDVRCTENNGGCQHRCTIADGNVRCRCHAGYSITENGRNCTDDNECNTPNRCPTRELPYCVNQPGTFFCTDHSCTTRAGYYNKYRSSECCAEDPDDSCGRDAMPGQRIVGGRSSVFGGWPWMVYILIDNRILCGGTLVGESWVVTAGHCFSDSTANTTVKTFHGRLNPHATRQQEPHVQERIVNQIILHEQWDKNRFPYHDIALLHLSTPVVLGEFINVACLPNGEKVAAGTRCWATGYGTTAYRGPAAKTLQEVDLLAVETSRCKGVYQNTEYPIDEDIMFCAGHEGGGKDSCQGDSGGPLVCQRCSSCGWFLAGVVSFGKGCARPNYFGVYTDVEYHEEWINRHTGIPVGKNKACGGPVRVRWSTFDEWSDCAPACGNGLRTRTRACLNGHIGHPDCPGSETETENCSSGDCPSWGEYGEWSACSASCGGGDRSRMRSCMNGEVGDIGCDVGSENHMENCNEHNCPTWNAWDPWSSCSVTCGGGNRDSSRTCNNYGIEGATCDGSSTRSEPCNEQICPRWEQWGTWSECSESCGGGMRMKERRCLDGNPGDQGCHDGTGMMSQGCNTQICGTWSSWGDWDTCSVTCAGGRQRSTRTCAGGTAGEGGCPGQATKRRQCNEQDCPVWGPWRRFGACSKSCGGGTKTRSRPCINGQPEQIGCHIGEAEMTVNCNSYPCPMWGNWTEWGECSKQCGNGTRNSSRECLNGVAGDMGCTGPTLRTENCNTHRCPRWTSYSNWSQCSVTCGRGNITKTRECMYGNPGDYGCHIGTAAKHRACNTHACPYWGNWTSSGECSETCGQGTIPQTRECHEGDVGQAGCIGQDSRMEDCKIAECPGRWTDWSNNNLCSVSCGEGWKYRTRTCEGGDVGRPNCIGSAFENVTCGEACLPRWDEWGAWSTCSQSCSGGTRTRNRGCIDGQIGQPNCTPANKAQQTHACNEELCPECVDTGTCFAFYCIPIYLSYTTLNCRATCNLCGSPPGPWGRWTTCTASCDGGTQTRRRGCSTTSCDGSLEQLRGCNMEPCTGFTQWSAWSSCSASCDGGTRTRSRECPAGIQCSPDDHGIDVSQSENCGTDVCPGEWGEWGDYSECSETCGRGLKVRSRECIGGEVGEPGCEDADFEQVVCTVALCPGMWTDFEPVGSCSATCGDGTISEARVCNGGEAGSPGCEGEATRTTNCNLGECITRWGDWSAWGTCTETCGGGDTSRSRECENGDQGDVGCEGDDTETNPCNSQTCETACRDLATCLPSYCTVYRTYADINCRATCGLCGGGGGTCTDTPGQTATCASLISLCSSPEYTYFRINCRRTCNFC